MQYSIFVFITFQGQITRIQNSRLGKRDRNSVAFSGRTEAKNCWSRGRWPNEGWRALKGIAKEGRLIYLFTCGLCWLLRLQESDAEQLRAKLKQLSDYDEIKRELEIMKVILNFSNLVFYKWSTPDISMSNFLVLMPMKKRMELRPMVKTLISIFPVPIPAKAIQERVSHWRFFSLRRTSVSKKNLQSSECVFNHSLWYFLTLLADTSRGTGGVTEELAAAAGDFNHRPGEAKATKREVRKWSSFYQQRERSCPCRCGRRHSC